MLYISLRGVKNLDIGVGMKNKTGLFLVIALCVVVARSQGATIQAQNGTSYYITGLEGFQTTGENMNGLQVWAAFADGSVRSAAWSGLNSGASVQDWFSISQSGDTFNYPWTIRNLSAANSIVSFGFSGADAGILFDREIRGFGTPGSANGLDFTFSDRRPVTAIYSDAVALAGQVPVGDLYTRLTVNLDSMLSPGAIAQFHQDTDTSSGRFLTVPDSGSTLLLVLLGFLGVATLQGSVIRPAFCRI
jgi:hypothetical protein